MKKKLTTFMFGLLLAVGWTGSAQAQALPQGGFSERLGLADIGVQVNNNALASMQKKAITFKTPVSDLIMSQKESKLIKAQVLPKPQNSKAFNAPRRADDIPDMVSLTAEDAAKLFYKWTDANGQEHESAATEVATDPYQIYEFLRFVYGNPAFPGPTYSAYKPDGTREDPVYYGAIGGGWNINAAGSGSSDDEVITITTSDTYAFMDSIYVKVGDQLLTSYGGVTGDWNSSTYAAIFPTGWTASPTATYYVSSGQVYAFFYQNGGGTITIPKSLLQGNTTVQVYIEGLAVSDSYASTLTVNGQTQSLTSEKSTLTWTVTFPEPVEGEFVQGTVEAPIGNEGYTALMVSLYDDCAKIEEPSAYSGSFEFTTKEQIINYIEPRIKSVKLLTDGLRIGDKNDRTIGTVFSCDGTYNKFFFLGKGQARKKAPRLYERMASSYWNWPSYVGEKAPFKEMFEQFSPTTGDVGADITDFYSKMNEGNVYDVVHDCGSVLQMEHQFSMSGKTGNTSYAMTGMNFFIPDFRLLWWSTSYSYNNSTYTVDGRDMNTYEYTTSSGDHGDAFISSNTLYSYFSAYYAQYNPAYAPKVGIYKITLDATATQVAQLYAPGNRNYAVTLTWVSSLNEMSGHEVPQTYTVYYFDENGQRQYLVVEGVTTTDGQTGVTTLTYYVEQFEHSYTIDYIVEGSPNDTEHPQFVAVSNIDGVVIPGWNDFVGLELDHHESDFVVADMANWYRNFLSVVNEDLYNGLSVSAVTGADGGTPINKFSLYRYNYNGTEASSVENKVADIELFDATPAQVKYRVTYDDDATDPDMEDQQVLAAKYQREAMGIKDEGVIRVKGNGDLVIWPNNYFVNFKSITIKNGTQPVDSWDAASMSTLPNGWETSPGSKWEEFTHNGVKVGYMEGGGYIYIPNLLNQYSNLSVEIEAFGEGANVKRIAVNDETQDITATAAGTTYTWNALSPNALHAPKNATERNTSSLVFTQACGGSGTADDGTVWTVTSDASESNFDSTKGIHYGTNSASVSYIELSTSSIPGTIKKVVVNASTASDVTATTSVTVGGSAFGTAQSISTTATDYTFEGSASGNIVVRIAKPSSAKKALYCKSVTVTYETESGSEETTTANLTVCDGNYLAGALPVYGAYHSYAQHNQMVYPASMLTEMAGKKIKSMTFYPTDGFVDADGDSQYDYGETTYSGINFYGGSITFKLANLSSGTAAFADENATLITGTMTPVKTLNPTMNTSATTWVIEFDQEFTYDGGDLLIDVTNTTGTAGNTAFMVDAVDANRGAYTLTYNGTNYAYGADFLPKVTFAYETEGGEAPAVEGGLLRMHLLLVDQLKQEIPVDNGHPDAYGYVLRYEPNGPNGDGKKQSGHVKVNIEKTDAQPNGYYTVAQINNDRNIDTTLLTMDILDAQVKMNLNAENPNVLYFQMQGAPKNTIPDTYLTQLQYMKNVRRYEEMLEGSAHKGEQYDADKVHYYFNDATPERGNYAAGDWKAYAPSVSTWGIDRRYYEADGENNTYGAPIWKTSVGKVEVVSSQFAPQTSPAVNWSADGKDYCLNFLSVHALGTLPNYPTVTNIEYEPYMFSVFVESPSGNLRKFKKSEDGKRLVDAGPVEGLLYLDSFPAEGSTNLDKGISEERPTDTNPGWEGNLQFGALKGITDLNVYVRFYFMVKGWDANANMFKAGEGVARPGNGAESPGFAPGQTTAVIEWNYQPEVVEQMFFNAQGMQSETPFSGINIVVTRYSDGTTTTTKVVR